MRTPRSSVPLSESQCMPSHNGFELSSTHGKMQAEEPMKEPYQWPDDVDDVLDAPLFEPVATLPAQWVSRRSRSPHENLWLAVLELTWSDLQAVWSDRAAAPAWKRKRSRARARHYREAWLWIFGTDGPRRGEAGVTFVDACSLVGLNAEAFRERAAKEDEAMSLRDRRSPGRAPEPAAGPVTPLAA